MSGSGQIRKDNYIPEKLYKPIVNANFKEPHLALPTMLLVPRNHFILPSQC